jgi:uncharacterized protein YyaL (SSP411 family)
MHTNALAAEKSPYLRQHAHNPVDWLPWGDAAFAKARNENKPIFLSVGYSTCHWCHVMAHESFEDERVAAVLNREFVPVKLDREERPDVDRVYMLFVQASTGSGGWPMSVWLTPELKPFFGGTYFPPDSRYGRPGFIDILKHIAKAWVDERGRIEESSGDVLGQLADMTASAQADVQADRQLFSLPFGQFRRSYDSKWGGFGTAPKFPRPSALNYLVRYHSETQNPDALEMVTGTLLGMAKGGMHDHLGGGFHRYSVDGRWFVPHFEKMLYDQAQLATSYIEAFQVTGQRWLADVAVDILEYVRRDMTDREGGFYSAEDADSPDPEDPSHSREGAFYVWTKAEIDAVLGPARGETFRKRYGVEEAGNVAEDPHSEFVGRNILYEAESVEGAEEELRESRARLLAVRSQRPRPHLDNKVLTAWNGLMISAFARVYLALGRREYLESAEGAMGFVLRSLYDSHSGRLLRRWCEGEAGISGFLDDYAFTVQALLDLFEATGKSEYLVTAGALAREGFPRFADTQHGGFFSTAENASDLVLRIKDDYDGAEPSGNSVATDVLLRLSHLTGDNEWREQALKSLAAFSPKLKSQPSMAPQMAVALGRALAEPEQVVIRCGERTEGVEKLAQPYRSGFHPWRVTLILSDHDAEQLGTIAPFLASLKRSGRITIYECRNFVCELPRAFD